MFLMYTQVLTERVIILERLHTPWPAIQNVTGYYYFICAYQLQLGCKERQDLAVIWINVVFVLPSKEPFLALLSTQTPVQYRDAWSSVGTCKDATLNHMISPWPFQHLYLHPRYLKNSSVWLILHLEKASPVTLFPMSFRTLQCMDKEIYKMACFVGYADAA